MSTPHIITIYTDHKNLTFYRSAHRITRRVARYLGELADYYFTLVHKPGTLNRADMFSRRPDHDNGALDNEDVVVLGPELFANAAEILDLEQEVFAAQKEHENEMKKLREGFSLNELDEKWFYHGHPVVPEVEGLR